MTEPTIRRAAPDDLVALMRLFDGALLETDPDRIRRQLAGDGGCVLLALLDGRPVGAVALVTDEREVEKISGVTLADDHRPPVHITAIAVARTRRNAGIGRALIEAAADRVASRPLSATFDERVRPFYRACGFEIESGDGRLWGLRHPD